MSGQKKERSEEGLRHEYTEVVQSIRHYSNLRFAIFTILFAVMGGVGLVAFSKEQFDAQASMVARIGGFPVIAFFWWYVERGNQQFDFFISEAIQLERDLGYQQFTRRPTGLRFLPNHRAVARIFFSLLTVLWAYAIFTVPLDR